MKQIQRRLRSRKALVAAALVAVCCISVAGTACTSSAASSDAASSVSSAVETPSTIERVAGNASVDTAVSSSQAAFPQGSEYVILARDDDYKDSMSATGLAGAYDAPILLTNRTAMSAQTLKEIDRLGAKTVFLIGGTGAVSPDVEGVLN